MGGVGQLFAQRRCSDGNDAAIAHGVVFAVRPPAPEVDVAGVGGGDEHLAWLVAQEGKQRGVLFAIQLAADIVEQEHRRVTKQRVQVLDLGNL